MSELLRDRVGLTSSSSVLTPFNGEPNTGGSSSPVAKRWLMAPDNCVTLRGIANTPQ